MLGTPPSYPVLSVFIISFGSTNQISKLCGSTSHNQNVIQGDETGKSNENKVKRNN